MSAPPLVTIVTPSLNSGKFLEQTIASVLQQDYPRIEYRIMDGGSTDCTSSILDRYRHALRVESKPDGGPASALACGFSLSGGEVLAYIAADDVYLPGAVSAVMEAFERNPDAAVVYGDAEWIDEGGSVIGNYPVREFDPDTLSRECFICHPAAFIRRSAYEDVGGLDPSLRFNFDYDLWLRLARRHRFLRIGSVLAQSRMHRTNLSMHYRRQVFRETIRTVRANTGYAAFGHVYAYACHLVDRRDQFFEPLQPSLLKYALALTLGTAFNGTSCVRFWRESLAAVRGGRNRR